MSSWREAARLPRPVGMDLNESILKSKAMIIDSPDLPTTAEPRARDNDPAL